MTDYEKCAEVCEEYGFARQAALLRAVAQGGLWLFAVCERSRSDDGFLNDQGGVPVALFLDREDAERDARRRDLLAYRTLNLYEYCDGEIGFMSGLMNEDFEREVSAILDTNYKLPNPRTHKGGLFPVEATDEQLLAISRLFFNRPFYIAELEFTAGANPTFSAESPS